MAMTINTNVVSINAQRNLGLSGSSLGTTMQRLSSGLRVNSAKDDAAGLAISERMRAQSTGLAVAARNANDGISLAQTTEGALGKIGDMLQRQRELAVQSSNATNSDSDRAALQAELSQLTSEIDRVAKTTSFNNTKVLDGSFTGGVFQVGSNAGDNITIAGTTKATANGLGTVSFGKASQTVVAGVADDTVLSDLTKIDAEVLSIKVGDNEVKLGAIAKASTEQERLGQVAAAINEKSAETGVTAFLNADGNSYTMEVRSEKGEAVEFKGFTEAKTGVTGTPKEWEDLTSAFAKAGDDTEAETAEYKAAVTTLKESDLGGYKAVKEAIAAFEAVGGATETKSEDIADAVTNTIDVVNAMAAYEKAVKEDPDAAFDTLLSKVNTANGDTALVDGTSTAAEVLTAAKAYLGLAADASILGKAGGLNIEEDAVTSNTGIDKLDIGTQAGAWEAIKQIDAAIDQVNAARADLGALQTRFEKSIENIDIQNENISAARGRIVDADFATETANLSRAQILQQAGTAMVAQANQLPQGVLSLLQ